jgi:prophage maintenance system killer protein
MFLRMNEVQISCSQADLEEFTLLVATSHPPIDELAGWLKEHTRRV